MDFTAAILDGNRRFQLFSSRVQAHLKSTLDVLHIFANANLQEPSEDYWCQPQLFLLGKLPEVFVVNHKFKCLTMPSFLSLGL